MRILGISAYYHDSAAALLEDGRIVAAAQEERFSRRKHDSRFPHAAIRFCLERAGVDARGLDQVVFYDKPFLKFERLLETYLAFAPRGFASFSRAMPIWLREKLFLKSQLKKELSMLEAKVPWSERLLFTEHHLSHAASAFYPSPFTRAAVLTLDGVGEWATTSAAIGDGNRLEIFKEIHFPHSLGLLYSAFTYYAGFKVNSGEYKLMGLAPYGRPRFAALILEQLIDLKPDGSFRLNLDYFDYCTGLRMTNRRFERLFGEPARAPESTITQFHMDIAASIQAVLEEAVLRLTRSLRRETGLADLCLAGGVALNCVANGKIARAGDFTRVWVQPAAGDAGGALGAALAAHHLFHGRERRVTDEVDGMQGGYLGPEFSDAEIGHRLRRKGARFQVFPPDALVERTAEELASGRTVGWFQGRMEFGPRALGARSILADPRRPEMQKNLNLRIKFRESFRPFAPSVLREQVADWFDFDGDSPYMLMVAEVAKARRAQIPAVTHVDQSARLQTVHAGTHPVYHSLLSAFHRRTGCPVLVNTSFNVRGEPPVCTPEDAFDCFMATGLETLAIGSAICRKEDQDPALKKDYRERLSAD